LSKETILNIAFNRWQFNRPRYVGKLSEAIRACAPRSREDWEAHYLRGESIAGIEQKFGEAMEEHLLEVGRRLYAKISEVLKAEVESITEEDCIQYVREVVIDRTYEGYVTEKRTVYERLESLLGLRLVPAPDEWDRSYNVDFYVPVGNKAVGIQIKPTTYQNLPEQHRWHAWMEDSHRQFQEDHGGRVFIVFSVTSDGEKTIANPEVVDEIRVEIERLQSSGP